VIEGPRSWGQAPFRVDGPVWGFALEPDEQACWVVLDGGLVRIDLETGRIVHTIRLPRANLVALSRDGRRIARCMPASGLTVHELPSMTEVWRHDGLGGVAISADGETVALATASQIDIWRVGSAEPLLSVPGNHAWISPDGTFALIKEAGSGWSAPTSLYRVPDRSLVRTAETGLAWAVAWSRHGERVAWIDWDQRVHIWTGRDVSVRSEHMAFWGLELVVVGDEELVLAADRDRVALISPDDGRLRRELGVTRDFIGAVTADQRRVVHKHGRVIDLQTGAVLREGAPPGVGVVWVRLSPSGHRALVLRDHQLIVWDTVRWEPEHVLDDLQTHSRHAGLQAELAREGIVIVDATGVVSLLQPDHRIAWQATLTPDPASGSGWEFGGGRVEVVGDTLVVHATWMCRGRVEADGHQDFASCRGAEAFSLADGSPLGRVSWAAPATPSRPVQAAIDSDGRIAITRDGELIGTLDVVVEHGHPSVTELTADGRRLLVGTHRGVLLGYELGTLSTFTTS